MCYVCRCRASEWERSILYVLRTSSLPRAHTHVHTLSHRNRAPEMEWNMQAISPPRIVQRKYLRRIESKAKRIDCVRAERKVLYEIIRVESFIATTSRYPTLTLNNFIFIFRFFLVFALLLRVHRASTHIFKGEKRKIVKLRMKQQNANVKFNLLDSSYINSCAIKTQVHWYFCSIQW